MATTEEIEKYCRNCVSRDFVNGKGLVCSRTRDLPAFKEECESFQKDEELEKMAPPKPDDFPITLTREEMLAEENLPKGVLYAVIACIVGAAAWGLISVSTGYQIGYMAIGIGFLVGFAMRQGKGIRPVFGIIGATLASSDIYGELPSGYEAGYVDSLSNRSHSRSNGHDLNVGVNYSDDTWMFNASLGVTPQRRTIDRKVGKLYADTAMNMIDFQPMIWMSWRKKEMRVSLNYNGNTRQPSLSDLMPLTDNSNPLYITRGNPDLKQMFSHNIRLNFQNSPKGISANLGGQVEQNSVTQVMIYDVQTGGRETYPVNINGNWNLSGGASWWKRFGHFSLRLDMSGNHSNRVGMINEDKSLQPEKSTTRDTGLNCEAQASYQPSWGGIDLSTSWNYQYSLNSLNDNDTYTRYYNFGLNGYVDFPFGLQLRTDATYNLRSGTNIQKGEDDEILWNAGATWRFLKKKEAELSAYWADILGKKKSYGRMATSDGFYEYRTQEIKGYFIVTFKYNFRLMM